MTLRYALLHGFTGTPKSWDVVRGLLPDDAHVSAPALLGHCADASPAESFEAEVDRLASLLAAFGAGYHLCGYSLGGRLAIGLLARHPHLFTRATLIGAHPGLDSEEDRGARVLADERWCTLLQTQGRDAFLEEWENLPLFATQRALPADVRARQRAERCHHTAGGLIRSLRVTGLGRMPAYTSALEQLDLPVTLMAGEKDAKFRAIAEKLCGILQRPRLSLADGAGHNVVLERPDCVARELQP